MLNSSSNKMNGWMSNQLATDVMTVRLRAMELRVTVNHLRSKYGRNEKTLDHMAETRYANVKSTYQFVNGASNPISEFSSSTITKYRIGGKMTNSWIQMVIQMVIQPLNHGMNFVIQLPLNKSSAYRYSNST